MLTNRVKGVEYAIREIAAVAHEVEKSGKKVYHLNIGDPVSYDFPTPEFISDALFDASKKGKNYYVNSLGVVELMRRLETSLGQLMSPTLVFDYPTVEDLSAYIAGELLSDLELQITDGRIAKPNTDETRLFTSTDDEMTAAHLEKVSEAEAEALLLKKLETIEENL